MRCEDRAVRYRLGKGSGEMKKFRAAVWGYWESSGRHTLPWRRTRDPYKILVSEVMLQQTQISRVIPKYKEFLKEFPTVRACAGASLARVLRAWSGLGYNRRAKYLHDAAMKIVAEHRGDIREALRHSLPGVGPYTRAAVLTFAYNEPHVFLETNIRTAFIHYFFSGPFRTRRVLNGLVADRAIMLIAERAAEGQDPRKWNWALMDYGAYLKKCGVRNNHKSAHYVKQTRFKGSLRQMRGAILRSIVAHTSMSDLRSRSPRKFAMAIASLKRDGLIVRKKGKWRIA